MSEIFVASHFANPVSGADIQQLVSRCGGCFDTHGVQWRNLLLARDGSRALCHLLAPDAESARIALRRAGLPVTRLWSAQALQRPAVESPLPVNLVHEQHLVRAVTPQELESRPEFDACRLTPRHCFLSLDGLHLLTLAWVSDSDISSVSVADSATTSPWQCAAISTCHHPRDGATSSANFNHRDRAFRPSDTTTNHQQEKTP